MSIVLYIDDSPFLLTDIKRNKSYNKVIEGHVVNGNWLMKLSSTTIYAFEEFAAHYGWGDELVLRNECEYETYEEVEVDVSGDYSEIIKAADKIRIKLKCK